MKRARKRSISVVIPRDLRAKVKPWRETKLNEFRRAVRLAKGDKVIAGALLGVGRTTMYRVLNDLYPESVLSGRRPVRGNKRS